MRRLAVALALAACTNHPPKGPAAAPPDANETGEVEAPRRPPPEPAAPTLRLPAGLRATRYAAHLRVDPAKPTFDGELALDATLAAPAAVIWLDAERLTIDRADATEGGATIALTATPAGKHFVALRAAHPIPAGPLTIHVSYHGTVDDQDGRGAYRRQWNGEWYAFTQFEPVAARRVFPSIDEPSSKVPWQLTLDVPGGDVALSNTDGKVTAIDGGWQRYQFAATRPLPTYLIAFAVGPFELVDGGTTASGKRVRIAVPRGRTAEAAYAAKVTTRIVGLLEAWFGTPYPYDKLDLVVTPNNSGAMENAGMITFAETRLLIGAGDPSARRRHTYASYAAHEIAHHWFGDLVTTEWWDDIWLNEAFATWMEDKILAELEPSWHAELDDVASLGFALGADDLASARMIRQPIATEDDIYNAFDGITYEKGAAVIRMFEAWAGPDKFQAGVRAYLKKHADGNATADDFLAAIGDASGKDVATPFKTFLEQAGAPRVTATITCAKGAAATIALHQERYLPRGAAAGAPQTWQIPVCVTWDDDRGGRASRACTLLAAADGALDLGGAACPTWAYANSGARGYYHVGLDAAALDAIVKKGWRFLDDAERIQLADDVETAVAHGDLDAGAALELVPRLLAEKHGVAVEAAVGLATHVEPYVPDAQRAAYQAWIRKTFGALAAKLGWTAKKGEDADAERARVAVVPLVAIAGADPKLRKAAAALAATWQQLPSDLARGVIGAAAEDPAVATKLVDDVRAPGLDRRQRRDLLTALAGVHDDAARAQVLALSLDKALEWTFVIDLPALTANDPASRAAGAAFARDHLAELAARVPEDLRGRLAFMVTRGCDPATRDDAAKAAETFRGAAGGPRLVSQAIEAMDECIAQRALQGPALATYFRAK